jgi:hypothetical protein|tara:strand:+ start:358 stop:504 length:147 start_codon:yes stop_codon:yes gene_type:complete
MNVYKVWVTQYCKAFDVVASDADEAKRIATDDMAWEVISAEVEVEKIS